MWRDRRRYRAELTKSRKMVKLAKLAFIGAIFLVILFFVGIPVLSLTLPSPDKIVRQTGFSTHRTDVVMEEDVIEEILRIYGYDKIPVNILSLSIPPVVTPDYINQELKLKGNMVALGLNEVISSTFVKEGLLTMNSFIAEGLAEAITLSNPPSPDNKVLRMGLLPNLYEFTKKIIDERGLSAKLFEIGKIYFKEKGKYIEKRKLGIIVWNKTVLNFANFKGIMDGLFLKNNINSISYSNTPIGAKLNETFSISVRGEIVGFGGKYEDIYFCEIDLDSILDKSGNVQAKLWPKYPPQIEDYNFVFPEKTKIGEVTQLTESMSNLINKVELKDIYKNSYTLHIEYQDPNKTLTDTEVEQIRNKILQKIKEKFGGQIKN